MTSEQIDQLATALALAQGEMTNAPLNKVNPHFKNKYADLAAIREATLPALTKNGLAIMQVTQLDNEGLVLVTRLAHKSGQWVDSVYPLPIGAAPQALGSALTYARRYSWASVCGIASEDDDDAETASKGNGSAKPVANGIITSAQLTTLRNAVKEVDADEALFAKYMKVGDLATLPAREYDRALAALDAKRGAKQ